MSYSPEGGSASHLVAATPGVTGARFINCFIANTCDGIAASAQKKTASESG
jgi:hypothetical protein